MRQSDSALPLLIICGTIAFIGLVFACAVTDIARYKAEAQSTKGLSLTNVTNIVVTLNPTNQ